MKILFIDHYYGKHLGGGEEYLLTVATGLKDLGYDVYLLALPAGCLSNAGRERGIKTLEANFFTRNIFNDIRTIESIISEVRPDLINIHGYYSGIIGRIASRRQNVLNIVCTVHTEATPYYAGFYHRIRNIIEKLTSNSLHYIAVSRTIYNQLVRIGLSPENMTVIHPAYDENLRPPKRKSKRDRLIFGAVGRLESVKGFDILIKAFSEVIKECSSAVLHIYGDGSQKKYLENLIRKLGLENSVFLKGYRPAQEIFDSIDVFVSSSLSEGFPLALLNAARLGIPSICTRAGGQTEIIRNEDMGLIAEPGSIDSLADALLAACKDYEKMLKLAENAKISITDEFSPENLVKKHDEFFRKIAEK
jgi:hypothetical protein